MSSIARSEIVTAVRKSSVPWEPDLAFAGRWKSTVEVNHIKPTLGWPSCPFVDPAMPLDSKICMVCVHSPFFAVISRGILYVCPVLNLPGSVNPSSV